MQLGAIIHDDKRLRLDLLKRLLKFEMRIFPSTKLLQRGNFDMIGRRDSIQDSTSKRRCWICGDESLAIEMLEQRLLSGQTISRRSHKELSNQSAYWLLQYNISELVMVTYSVAGLDGSENQRGVAHIIRPNIGQHLALRLGMSRAT